MSDKTKTDVVFIRELAELLDASDLNEIEVERVFAEGGELKVRLARGQQYVAAAPAPAMAPAPHAAHAPAPAPAPAPGAPADAPAFDLAKAVTSPMVGTVYLAPEPGASAFVSVGEDVQEGQTVLIIEAMKTMNQIPAPRAGKVRAILVENGEPVEFGEPLIVLD